MRLPQCITVAQLEERLRVEQDDLQEPLANEWKVIRQTPTVVRYAERTHFVVARTHDRVIFFADDEDEFGIGRITAEGTLADYGLAGDLRDAIAIFSQSEASGDGRLQH